MQRRPPKSTANASSSLLFPMRGNASFMRSVKRPGRRQTALDEASLLACGEIHPRSAGSEGDHKGAAFLLERFARVISFCALDFGWLLDAKPRCVQILVRWRETDADRSGFSVYFDGFKLPGVESKPEPGGCQIHSHPERIERRDFHRLAFLTKVASKCHPTKLRMMH